MKKIMFVLLASIMLASMFVFVKQTKALSNGMCLDPVNYVVNPPMDGSDLTFDWDLNLSTTYDITGWEAWMFWNPDIIQFVILTWAGVFTSTTDVFVPQPTNLLLG